MASQTRNDTANLRKIAASARLLPSNRPGEVVAAVGAIGRLLPVGLTIADVIERGLMPTLSPQQRPTASAYIYSGSWKQRARMAQGCPHLTPWEHEFVLDIVQFSKLSQLQENRLQAIFRKSEGVRS